jgi:TIR domain
VAVEPPALPASRGAQAGSLRQIRYQEPPILAVNPDAQVWDVFISHAGEDKAAVARPLSEALTERGVIVWLDDNELRIGDSLRRKIDAGLASSRFGIVVFSRSFFAKGWPQYELDGIVARSVSGEQKLLPIWHEITKAEVMAQSPSLADKIARNTALLTIEEIADEVAEVVLDRS